MTEYRRAYIPGGSWFFTVNLVERKTNRLLVEKIDLGHFYKSKFRHNTLLLTKNVSLHINYMLRHHFLLAPRFVWNFEFLEVPFTT